MSKRPERKRAGGPPLSFDDNPECTAEDFARAVPASALLGSAPASALVRRRGRPPLATGIRKEAISIRMSPEVLDYFRSQGDGWQTMIDDVLRKHVANTR